MSCQSILTPSSITSLLPARTTSGAHVCTINQFFRFVVHALTFKNVATVSKSGSDFLVFCILVIACTCYKAAALGRSWMPPSSTHVALRVLGHFRQCTQISARGYSEFCVEVEFITRYSRALFNKKCAQDTQEHHSARSIHLKRCVQFPPSCTPWVLP